MTDRAPTNSTRTDLRLTRSPADTPRARLHHAAAAGARAARKAHQAAALIPDMAKLRDLARRGINRLKLDESRGARLVVHVCDGLDRALEALLPLVQLDAAWICEELISALVQLEASEDMVARLKSETTTLRQEIAFEHNHNEQLRTSLAAAQVRAAAALLDVPRERFEEPTRSCTLSAEEMAVIDELGSGTVSGLGVAR